MRKLALLLAVVLWMSVCLSGCGKHDDMIEDAIVELEDYWTEIYDTSRKETAKDRYFEIKNTRVITLCDDALRDIEYIVEFVLYTDYYGSAIYVDASMVEGSAVAVYRDGSMRVVSNTTIVNKHIQLSLLEEDEDIVESVDDYGDKYNCKKTLD